MEPSKTTPTKASNSTNHRVALVVLVVVGLVFGGCGSKQTQLQSDLVGTEWVIMEMTGFPENNFADATFTFKNDWFGYYDGVNWGSSEIMWNETGFAVTAGGISTDVGARDGDERYLHTLLESGTHVEIVQNDDGSLVLTRNEMTITAERGQIDLAAELQSSLTGTQWVIVAMTGFPDDNVVAGDFAFTNERFRYYDGFYRVKIEWHESGFTVREALPNKVMDPEPDDPGLYLGMLVPVRARVEIVQNDDGSLTLTQGELTVTAEPAA